MDNCNYLKFKDFAFRYFEGRLHPDKEEELEKFLSEDKSHRDLFKEWERQEAAERKVDFDTEKALLLVNHKIREHALKKRISIYKWCVGIAAAVTVLVVLCVSFGEGGGDGTNEVLFTCSTPNGEKSLINLPDGSMVWLNSCSSLTYSNRFSKSERKVKMTGECYFDVAKSESDEPFLVETSNGCRITVRGTEFNVSAYEDDDFISTVLIKGTVDVVYKDFQCSLEPGNMFHVNLETGETHKKLIDVSEVDSWRSGHVQYSDISLSELLVKLSRRYNVKFDVEQVDPHVMERRFRISMRNNETVRDIMMALERLLMLKVEFQEDVVVIR